MVPLDLEPHARVHVSAVCPDPRTYCALRFALKMRRKIRARALSAEPEKPSYPLTSSRLRSELGRSATSLRLSKLPWWRGVC